MPTGRYYTKLQSNMMRTVTRLSWKRYLFELSSNPPEDMKSLAYITKPLHRTIYTLYKLRMIMSKYLAICFVFIFRNKLSVRTIVLVALEPTRTYDTSTGFRAPRAHLKAPIGGRSWPSKLGSLPKTLVRETRSRSGRAELGCGGLSKRSWGRGRSKSWRGLSKG